MWKKILCRHTRNLIYWVKSVPLRPQKIFNQISIFEIWQFISPLRYKDSQYLIWKIYIFLQHMILNEWFAALLRWFMQCQSSLILLHKMAFQPFWLDISVYPTESISRVYCLVIVKSLFQNYKKVLAWIFQSFEHE